MVVPERPWRKSGKHAWPLDLAGLSNFLAIQCDLQVCWTVFTAVAVCCTVGWIRKGV